MSRNLVVLSVLLGAFALGCASNSATTHKDDSESGKQASKPDFVGECEVECDKAGLCGKLADGSCLARDAKDCKSSSFCEEKGECTFSAGKCIASTDEECKNSVFCKEKGACTLKAGKCVSSAGM